MNEQIQIRTMVTEDLEEVTAIEAQVFSVPWTKDGFAAALDMSGANYLVAVNGKGTIAGYCGYYSCLDEAEVTNVAVVPAYRKQGYATAMLQELLRQAKGNGIKKVFLEVRFSNHGAISLYEKLGFVKLGLRKNFYEKPKEDAILMMLEI